MSGAAHRGGKRWAILLFATGLIAASRGQAVAQSIVRITIKPATLDLAISEVILLTAEATFSDGSTANVSELVEWQSSNRSVARVVNTRGSKGKLTARAVGQASISARDPVTGVASGQSGGNCIVTVLGRLQSLQVTPKDRRIDPGATKSLTAIGTFTSGATRDLTQQVTWTSSNSNVARVSNDPGKRGRVTAVSPGTATIVVTSSTGLTSTASGGDGTVRVPAALMSIKLDPGQSRLPVGLTLRVDAVGSFSDGTTDDISEQVTWSSSNPAVASVSDAEGTKGEVTALQTGTAIISVVDPVTGISSTPAAGDLVVTVAGMLTGLTLSPDEDVLPTGLKRTLTIRGTLDDGDTISLSRRDVQWTSSDPAVASVSNDPRTAGEITGVAKGTVTISALHVATGIRSAVDTRITVLGRMIGLALRPKSREIFSGQVASLSATALLDDGGEARLTRDLEFLSSDGAIATVSNQAGSRGRVTGISKGRATVSVVHHPTGMNSSDFGGDATITVRGRVEALRVDPTKAFYVLGTMPKMKVKATFDDGSSANIGSDVTWTTSDPSVAEIGNVSPNRGVLFPKKVGRVTVSAVEPISGVTTGASGGDGTITIVDGLTQLRVGDSNLELRSGDTLNLKAFGRYANPVAGPDEPTTVEVEITDFVEWTSSDTRVVRVAADGSLTAVGLGDATVGARDPRSGVLSNQSNGDAQFRVIAALDQLKITPGRIRTKVGGRRRRAFTAIGHYTDGVRIELTDRVVFTAADPTVAQVSNDRDRHGLVVPLKGGTTTVGAMEPITGVQAGRVRKVIVKGGQAGGAAKKAKKK